MPHGQRSIVKLVPRFGEYKVEVEQCIDPRLGGGYPLKVASKVTILLSLDVMCLSEQVEVYTV
jgi:hypothetical protein